MGRARATTILMADDDADDRELAQEALRVSQVPSDLRCVEDGEELLDYLNRRGRYREPQSAPAPGLILLDLNMPRMDGREVLRTLKQDPRLKRIPVVILSTSRRDEDVVGSYDLGANCFITKPGSFSELIQMMKVLDAHWVQTAELPRAALS
ncbi:response regulator [Stigmatella erecta]|uniref:Response regulator receiver protein n=1 Tax=Stigmatella erecta TaxID=83460 RepID=A0A1I0KI64_9BACT|nr:response regulator [Stigmatella erecta]SEU23430.1 response regulator receiver protein [Stigmatella erecta]